MRRRLPEGCEDPSKLFLQARMCVARLNALKQLCLRVTMRSCIAAAYLD